MRECIFDNMYISIHALRGEGDVTYGTVAVYQRHFNPRPPWGGRPKLGYLAALQSHFNPRPPWGGRLFADNDVFGSDNDFNPRPPWGGRPDREDSYTNQKKFQSTPSVGRATIVQGYRFPNIIISIHALRGEGDEIVQGYRFPNMLISIHALRGEGDTVLYSSVFLCIDFNPRPPWGGRHCSGI